MSAKPLTPKEKAWVKKLQKVLNECPSDRMEAYTIGDCEITILDKNEWVKVEHELEGRTDVCCIVEKHKIGLAHVNFPFGVWATAG